MSPAQTFVGPAPLRQTPVVIALAGAIVTVGVCPPRRPHEPFQPTPLTGRNSQTWTAGVAPEAGCAWVCEIPEPQVISRTTIADAKPAAIPVTVCAFCSLIELAFPG